MTLVKFSNPAKNPVNPWFNDVFDSLLNDSLLNDRFVNKIPAVNIGETETAYHIDLAVPGLKKEDFTINLDRDILSVAAERKAEKTDEGKKFSKREYSYNSFVRSFTLPETADQAGISAEYVDGILKLTVAKKEQTKMQAREIAVK